LTAVDAVEENGWMKSFIRRLIVSCLLLWEGPWVLLADDPASFVTVAEIFQRRCLSCHNDDERKGGLSLQSVESFSKGGESGVAVVAGKPDASYLYEQIIPRDSGASMPQDADPLTANEQQAIRTWIEQGAPWPSGRTLSLASVANVDWWSLRPLSTAVVPTMDRAQLQASENPLDLFIGKRLTEKNLSPTPPADRRTLLRRLSFDLLGLPPDPHDVDDFSADTRPDAYERMVDRYLASCRHGERWARHWLDVVHFGETHGYDKDKPRPDAWPYRDYVIRSFNEDKPYARFVREQLAGDVLYPDDPEGIIALGFLAAGPWDLIGHEEVPETKIDGKIARHLDRDDMVATTINTFCSMTVQCAQCHHHKFDPITQEDYYRLHAVFAAVDRTVRSYDADPRTLRRRREIEDCLARVEGELRQVEKTIREQGGPELADLERGLEASSSAPRLPTAFGYHSQIEPREDAEKWVQLDLGEARSVAKVVLQPCHDDFAGIGAGFGFPRRFRIELSDDPAFASNVVTLVDQTKEDVSAPGIEPVLFEFTPATGRYLRLRATRLALRQNDYIFALAELSVSGAGGATPYPVVGVTSLDSIEAPPRWQRSNLIDRAFPEPALSAKALSDRRKAKEEWIAQHIERSWIDRKIELERERQKWMLAKMTLPAPSRVYAAGIHQGDGAFRGTGADGGTPRAIHLLARGDVRKPGPLMEPGSIGSIPVGEDPFAGMRDGRDGDRRSALARWITAPDHPLTWRSIANRVWQYHFGRGLVETANDFGRMGGVPTHPELLDWLAVEVRDRQEGLKSLHRLLVTSATYRRSSTAQASDSPAEQEARLADQENRFLWRGHRRRMEAEELRDAILWVAGELDLRMEGPSFQDFVVEKPEHSPHYQYHLADLTNRSLHRRSVYRFLVRSQQQPWMATMDGADPSILVDKRNETVTPLQALALWNNDLVLIMAGRLAEKAERAAASDPGRVDMLYREAFARGPSDSEREILLSLAREQGWPAVARVLFNLNEFVFVD
jgi:hypothetical protein